MAQQPHSTLLIPGPIEFDDAVLGSMSHFSQSHIDPNFINVFGETLSMLRQLMQTSDPGSQPFIISGSGTLGWDLVAANLTAPGDKALVLHTGYFADSFADCFETYGVHANQVKAPIGQRPSLEAIEQALKQDKYDVITITHVDTSTGVLSDVHAVAELVHRVSPNTLIIADGVCSIGCEELQFDAWGIDVVITASQKAIGCPAGLSISMASKRAIERFEQRKTPPVSYFASYKNWIPIMRAYEARKPAYFATPSPQLVRALHTALTQLLHRPLPSSTGPVSSDSSITSASEAASNLAARVRAHAEVSTHIKHTLSDSLGLEQLASDPAFQAHGMTAFYVPDGVAAPDLLGQLSKRGVVFAGGLHKEIKMRYVRFGHMGVSAVNPARGDIIKALSALRDSLAELGYERARATG